MARLALAIVLALGTFALYARVAGHPSSSTSTTTGT